MLYRNLNGDIVFVLQELRGASARELEACRRELEEGSSRQRQHFLEEVELLKVQSEERLQDRINQLKVKKKTTKKNICYYRRMKVLVGSRFLKLLNHASLIK